MERFDQKELVFAQFMTDLSTLSMCSRAQCGCIIYPRDFSGVEAIGYNGPPRCRPNDTCSSLEGSCGCIHAEANAIAKLNGYKTDLVLMTTMSPCYQCAGLIVNCKRISVVVYEREYRNLSGLKLLHAAGIKSFQLEIPQ